MPLNILKCFRLKFGISMHQINIIDNSSNGNATLSQLIGKAVINILYTIPKAEDNYIQTARDNLRASSENTQTNIDTLLTKIFYHQIHDIGTSRMLPQCPREQEMFDRMYLPVLTARRNDALRLTRTTRQIYESMRDQLIRARDRYRDIDTEYKALLLRATLNPRKFEMDISLQSMSSIQTDQHTTECPICYEPQSEENVITTNCEHGYCYPCLNRYMETVQVDISSVKIPTCAMCRTNIVGLVFKNVDNMNNIGKKFCENYNPVVIDQEPAVVV